MKFRCGKCQTFNELAPGTGAGTDVIKIACKYCHAINKIDRHKTELSKKENQQQAIDKKKSGDNSANQNVPGWIFIHDENTVSQSFDLKNGENVIGRKSSLKTDIAIETRDIYMSRQHCMIEVVNRPGGGYNFLLSDINATNGTFLNAQEQKRLQKGDVFYLKDGDTIQLGMTKVVIRIHDNIKKEEAEKEVNKSSYAPTVIVKR